MPLNDNATNEILPFAPEGLEAAGDLMPLAEYKTLSARLRGFMAGIARRAIFNRAHRQAAHMAAGLAQYIANRHAPGVLDDADLDKVEEGLRQAVRADSALTPGNPGDVLSTLDNGGTGWLPGVDLSGCVPTGRKIATNSPLTGGGALNADLTLGVDLSAYAQMSRKINTAAPLTGGGGLSADRTLSIAPGPERARLLTKAGAVVWEAPIDHISWWWMHAQNYAWAVTRSGFWEIIVVGGGGGGGPATSPGQGADACAGGGGAGGYAYAIRKLVEGDSYTLTVGAGGKGGVGSTMQAATAGGSSSFGALLSATGGGPGGSADSWAYPQNGPFFGSGGDGGLGIGGDWIGNGSSGMPGMNLGYARSSGGIGGYGGASILSAGAPSDDEDGYTGLHGSGGGGGDTGTRQGTANGGPGGDGMVIVRFLTEAL